MDLLQDWMGGAESWGFLLQHAEESMLLHFLLIQPLDLLSSIRPIKGIHSSGMDLLLMLSPAPETTLPMRLRSCCDGNNEGCNLNNQIYQLQPC